MSLQEIEKNYCNTVTKYFKEHYLASPFLYPVDTSEVIDYLNFVQKPMDLSTIQKKLDNNVYKTSKEWSDDLMLIWDNAIAYNKRWENLILKAATILKEKAEKKIKLIPKNETDLWFIKLTDAANKVEKELNKSSSRSSKSKH